MTSITSANATLMITIGIIFPTPTQIQNFAADDVTDVDELESAQVQRGVDGNLSGGFVYPDIKQSIMLMADSPSIDIFDQWYNAQVANRTTYTANAIIVLDVGKKWTFTKGFLTGYKPLPQAKKLLQAQRFNINWESVVSAPSSV
jgi:hypothetical protein